MSQVPTDSDAAKKNLKRLWKLFLPLAGVTGALAFFAVLYFGYDLAKGNVSPCDSIFQQTTVGLSTKIKFLKAEGELKLGPEKVAELSERAQMTALDLKTCCTVLDAGRIDPEQFLACKAKARTYDARIEDVAALIKAALPTAASAAPTASASAPALEAAVVAARTVSQDFNQHVVKVAAEQQLKTLQAVPAAHLTVDAAEREPNDDGLNANLVELGKQVKAAIGAGTDADVYSFTTPPTYRDWIHVELQNQSTTLDPHLELFNAAKASIASAENTTQGGDLSYDFVAPPATKFSVRIFSHYGKSAGVYVISVAPKKAYDSFEPNDDILSARRIAEGTPTKAGIMDKNDVDVFSIAGAATGERAMTVTIANGSTTLHPHVEVYDAAKTRIGGTENTTAGGDLSYAFKAPKGPVYVRVSDHYASDRGDYTLTIAPQ
ncbi:MAG: hypothetical protein ABL996_12730 [Micropepsaceae bacterium]